MINKIDSRVVSEELNGRILTYAEVTDDGILTIRDRDPINENSQTVHLNRDEVVEIVQLAIESMKIDTEVTDNEHN